MSLDVFIHLAWNFFLEEEIVSLANQVAHQLV
jgi:hypothetical protein